MLGRLKPGVSLEQANADLDTIAVALEKEYPKSNTTRRVVHEAAARVVGRRISAKLESSARRGRLRAADRVCECRQSATRASPGAREGTRGPRRARRESLAFGASTVDGKCAARALRRGGRSDSRHLESRHDRGALSAKHSALQGNAHRYDGFALHRHRCRGRGNSRWHLAGMAHFQHLGLVGRLA